MYLALDNRCLTLLLWLIGRFPDSTGPTRLTLKDKIFQQREKLLQLTPEQQQGRYLLLVHPLDTFHVSAKDDSQLFPVEAKLSTSDFHLATALIYFLVNPFPSPGLSLIPLSVAPSISQFPYRGKD